MLQSGKKTAWFSATVVTNNSGNCLPCLILFKLNYCVVVPTYSILVYVSFKNKIRLRWVTSSVVRKCSQLRIGAKYSQGSSSLIKKGPLLRRCVITSEKGGSKCFCACSFVGLSACLSVCSYQDYSKTRAWIWTKCCVSTDVGTWTNWSTFEPDPDYSPDDGTRLLSPIS